MNTADYVDQVIAQYKEQIANGGIPLSEAAWQTALSCVDWPYVYSAWGAYCTVSERKYRYNLCPTKTTILSKCQVLRDSKPKANCEGCQWFPGGKRVRCFDCRGFTDWILKQYGFDLYGDTVGSQWGHADNWCVKGTIGVDPIPQNVLVNIFIKKDGKWSHTGFYYNGSTVECSVNVQYHEKMVANRWTHWAIAACFKSGWTVPDKEPEKEKPVANETKYATLRKGSKGELVTMLQKKLMELGYQLPRYGADGDYGNETINAVKQFQKDHGLTADGVVGEKTWSAINSATVEPQKYYTVTVPHKTKEIADEIIKKYGGSYTAE